MEKTSLELTVAIAAGWVQDYQAYLDAQGRSPLTVRAYLQDLRSLAAWYRDAYREPFTPDQLTSRDVRAYKQHLALHRAAPASINRALASIRVLCGWGMAAGYLSFDPSQGVRGVKAVELPPRWLERGELHKLLRQCELELQGARTDHWRWQAARDQAMIALMVFAGLREGELVALNLDDMQLSERKGRLVVRHGKGDKRREVPLSVEARRALHRWLEERRSERSGDALFIGKVGERLSTRTVQRRVAEIGAAAGLARLTPHDLRHTFAKRLIDAGVSPKVVQTLLGHARLETTFRYAKPGWEDYEDAVEKI